MDFATSLNDTLRRKTRSLRHKHRRLTQILPFFQLTPTKSAKLDISSIEKIFKYLETDHQIYESPAPEKVISNETNFVAPLPPKPRIKNSVSTFPPKIEISVDASPSKPKIEVFKRLPSKDLLSLRLVCKDFNQIIQNHALELPKILREAVTLFQVNNQIQLIGCSSNSAPMNLEAIDRPLRYLQMKSLCLTEVTVTSTFIKYLHRSIKYELQELRFIKCNFAIK